MKDIKLLVSSILIVISFFIGILFGRQINENKINEIKNEAKYINIDIKKSKVDVENPNKNIYISINGKPIDEANLTLNEICN